MISFRFRLASVSPSLVLVAVGFVEEGLDSKLIGTELLAAKIWHEREEKCSFSSVHVWG